MKYIIYLYFIIMLAGCVSGAPTLTEEQEARSKHIEVYMSDNKPNKNYVVLGEVSAADCNGLEGTMLYGDETKSIGILIKKAVVLNADAVMNISCSSVPYVNNCWLAKKCDGNAVKWN